MSDFFEIDPVTGIRTDTSYNDETGELTLIRSADVEPLLDWTNKVRNEAGINKQGIKENWWLYAKIPPIEIVRMRAKGIDITKEADFDRMLQEINEFYPNLKCTTGREGKRSTTKYFMPNG